MQKYVDTQSCCSVDLGGRRIIKKRKYCWCGPLTFWGCTTISACRQYRQIKATTQNEHFCWYDIRITWFLKDSLNSLTFATQCTGVIRLKLFILHVLLIILAFKKLFSTEILKYCTFNSGHATQNRCLSSVLIFTCEYVHTSVICLPLLVGNCYNSTYSIWFCSGKDLMMFSAIRWKMICAYVGIGIRNCLKWLVKCWSIGFWQKSNILHLLIHANKLDLHDLCLMSLQTTCCVHASAVYNAAACILCQRLVTDTVQ